MNFFGGGKEVKPPYKLPDPDAWGNYWLSRGTTRVHGPVILHSAVCPATMDDSGRAVFNRWFVSRGGDSGVVFDGPCIRYYPDPGAALEALNGIH